MTKTWNKKDGGKWTEQFSRCSEKQLQAYGSWTEKAAYSLGEAWIPEKKTAKTNTICWAHAYLIEEMVGKEWKR